MMRFTLRVLVLVAAALFCSSFINTNYQTKELEHVIRAGETLWDVAAANMVKQDKHDDVRELIHDICQKNNITGNGVGLIRPGDVIVIPLQCKQR